MKQIISLRWLALSAVMASMSLTPLNSDAQGRGRHGGGGGVQRGGGHGGGGGVQRGGGHSGQRGGHGGGMHRGGGQGRPGGGHVARPPQGRPGGDIHRGPGRGPIVRPPVVRPPHGRPPVVVRPPHRGPGHRPPVVVRPPHGRPPVVVRPPHHGPGHRPPVVVRPPQGRRPQIRPPQHGPRHSFERRHQERRQHYLDRSAQIRRDRQSRADVIRRNRDYRHQSRSQWYTRHRVRPIVRNSIIIRNHGVWSVRYDRWFTLTTRPTIYVSPRPIRWYQPMPVVVNTGWSYSQVERVAENLEYLARDVYETLENVLATDAAGTAAKSALLELVAAADNFNDSVEEKEDFDDTLYDLFNLEAKLDVAEAAVSRSTEAHRVTEELRSLRYYVNELLYVYKQNH